MGIGANEHKVTLDVAVKLEINGAKLYDTLPGTKLKGIGLDGYTLVDSREFDTVQNHIKAITVKGPDDRLHVHYFGTGDGNWRYNAAAYGAKPQPSDMQKWASDYFDNVIDNFHVGGSQAKVVVTGHSQGGNSAQFVTMEARHSDLVDTCLSIDGPGFSHDFKETYLQNHGTATYDSRRSKIWSFNGENDFVSPLGQTSIVNEGQNQFIKYSGGKTDVMSFHAADGLVIDGEIRFVDGNVDAPFRKLISSLLKHVDELPREKQARAADLVMMLCEDLIGSGPIKANMSEREFNELKGLLVPVLSSFLANSTDMTIEAIMQLFDLDRSGAEAIAALLRHLGDYPEKDRLAIIEAMLALVTYDNGKFSIDTSRLPDAVREGGQAFLDALREHPDDFLKAFEALGQHEGFIEWLKAHPLEFVGVVIAVSGFVILVEGKFTDIELLSQGIDALIRTISTLKALTDDVRKMIVTTLDYLNKAIVALVKLINKHFNVGKRYVSQNPYFKADTYKLLDYARRIEHVNTRLRNLDRDLNDLYAQVRLIDVKDIIISNVITSYSPTLRGVAAYLRNTAERLQEAENQANQYLEAN